MDHGNSLHIKPTTGGTTSGGESDTGSGMASPGTSSMDELGNDAEGIWSPDIEQSFQEALAIYPPCGRRKIILSDEGKMYGRNELIARYIKLRTGKTRSRKQVSSHIQVLSRRKAKETTVPLKDSVGKDAVLHSMASVITQSQLSRSVEVKPTLPHPSLLQPASISSGPTGTMIETPAGFIPSVTMYAAAAGHPPPLWNPAAAAVAAEATGYYGIPMSSDNKPPIIIMPNPNHEIPPPWRDRSIAGPLLRLVELSAYVECVQGSEYNRHLFVHIDNNVTYADPVLESVDIRQIADKFPDKNGGLRELYDKGPQSAFFLVKFWADIHTDVTEDAGCFYGITSIYESNMDMSVQCSTKLCSFGKQVVEKIEAVLSEQEGSRYLYKFERAQMCEYLVNFIHKLKHLPKKFMMDSVLENFTILQTVTNKETQDTLLCIAYVFEVSSSERGAQCNIYRLEKD